MVKLPLFDHENVLLYAGRMVYSIPILCLENITHGKRHSITTLFGDFLRVKLNHSSLCLLSQEEPKEATQVQRMT